MQSGCTYTASPSATPAIFLDAHTRYQLSQQERATTPEPGSFYNEALEPSGELRGGYRRLQHCLGFDPLTPPASVAKRLLDHPFKDNISVNPVPLVLPASEIQVLRAASLQFSQALSMLFEDLVLGSQKVLSDGVIPKELISCIMRSSRFRSLEQLRQLWRGKTPEHIVFFFGPDFMRGPDRSWRMLEANIGRIGGIGDNHAIHRLYHKVIHDTVVSPADFEGAFKWKSDDLPILLQTLLRFHNAENTCLARLPSFRKWASAQIAYSRMRLGFDAELCRQTEVLKEMNIPLGYKELFHGHHLNAKAPGLIIDFGDTISDRIFTQTSAVLTDAPGTGALLSSKLLLPWLEKLVRYYMAETPVLKVQESKNMVSYRSTSGSPRFASAWDLFEPESFELDCPVGFVFKAPGLEQGEGVHVVHRDSLQKINGMVAEWVDSGMASGSAGSHPFVVQPFLRASQLAGSIVEVRPLGLMLGNGEGLVGELPWGKAREVPDSVGDGKEFLTNIAAGARELVVLAYDS